MGIKKSPAREGEKILTVGRNRKKDLYMSYGLNRFSAFVDRDPFFCPQEIHQCRHESTHILICFPRAKLFATEPRAVDEMSPGRGGISRSNRKIKNNKTPPSFGKRFFRFSNTILQNRCHGIFMKRDLYTASFFLGIEPFLSSQHLHATSLARWLCESSPCFFWDPTREMISAKGVWVGRPLFRQTT